MATTLSFSSSTQAYALAGVLLVAVGLYGLVAREHLIQKILAVNIGSSGLFLLLVALAPGTSDPVAQAMVLTGIVVTVSATGFALALARRIHAERAEGSGPSWEEPT